MKGARSTLVMFVVLVALGGYIYFVELERPPASETPPNEQLFELEADDIQTLTIRGSDGETSLRRTDDGEEPVWYLSAPVEARADEVEVSSVTSTLSSVEIRRVVEEGPVADLSVFGLAEPSVEVGFTVSGEDGEDIERHLLIGDSTPTGADRYAKLSDRDRIILVADRLESSFNKSTFDLRDKTILDVDTTDVDALRIVTDEGTIALSKDETAWRLEEPWATRASFSTVEGLVGRLGNGEFRSVEVENADDAGEDDAFGLGEPAITATLRSGSASASLAVGAEAPDGGRYARDASRPLVFTIDATLASDLERPADAYRETNLFGFRPFNATRLEVEHDGVTTIFEQQDASDDELDATWTRMSPEPADVERAGIDDLLASISNLTAESFVESREDAGLDDSTVLATIRARYGEDETEEEVVVWRVGEATYAVHGDEPGAAVVATDDVDAALAALDDIQPLDDPPSDDDATEP